MSLISIDRHYKSLKRILILDEFNSLNNGEMARVMSIADAIRALRPNTILAILSSSPEIDKKRYMKVKLNVIKRPWHKDSASKIGTLAYFLVAAGFTLLGYSILKILRKNRKLYCYDLCLHLTGDVINDKGLMVLFYHLYHICYGLMTGSKTVICAESIGPFRSKITAHIVRTLLNRLDLITVRERISKGYLDHIKIKNPNVILTADPAFLLKPTRVTFAKPPRKPILGISVNPDAIPYFSENFGGNNRMKYQKYAELLAHTIDEFIEKYDGSALLIAHVVRPDSDDIKMNRVVYSKIKHKERVRLLREHYTADEVKGIISLCGVFVGSRMHATIAAISSGIPTVVLGHSHKFHGVLEGLVDQETLIDIRSYNYEGLKSRLKSALVYAYENSEMIATKFSDALPQLQEMARFNARLIVSLLNSRE